MSAQPVAWITGAAGLIGTQLARLAPSLVPHWRVVGFSHDRLDLTDHASVRKQFERDRPHVIIHCAAMSRSPDCQASPKLAHRINVEATRNLAELAAEVSLIFFSSDLVFDGDQGYYTEADSVNPLSIYGENKAEAEQIVLRNPRHTVVRTSLNSGHSRSGNRAFNEEMRNAWKAGRSVRLFTDEYRCPIPAVATAEAVWSLASANHSGLYHVAGGERLSRWQIGELVAGHSPDLTPLMEACSRKQYDGPPRPADTSLDCAKINALLPSPLPRFSDWLRAHPEELVHQPVISK